MATIQQLLAVSLDELRKLQEANPHVVLKGTEQISRTHLRRLLDHLYWHFISAYARSRFGDDWCLSPEMSLDFHSGKTTVPGQLIIKSPKGNNNIVKLPYGHSMLLLTSLVPETIVKDTEYGLNLYSVASPC